MKKFVALLTAFTIIFCLGCSANERKTITPPKSGSAAYFLDVGEGDAVLIKLPDGKTALIDCGADSQANRQYLKACIQALGGKLDYFVLSHPDADHVGNAEFIAREFKIERAYLPYVYDTQRFNVYDDFYKVIVSKSVPITYSSNTVRICGDGYYFAFLSPLSHERVDSAYTDINAIEQPSHDKVNAVSPIIYFECDGVRFLFTGDAPSKVESEAIDYATVTLPEKVSLYGIDFLKVSHHGADDATDDRLLKTLMPKNAVISVGENIYGHPKSAVLNRIYENCPNARVLRTDVNGSVSVYIDEGVYTVQTAL